MDASLELQKLKLQQKLKEHNSDIETGLFEGYMLDGKKKAINDIEFLLDQIDKVDNGEPVNEEKLDELYSKYRMPVEWILIEAGII